MTSSARRIVPLRVTGLMRSFGRHSVLRGVDLEVKSGEVVGLMGANGSGKTTLFSIISGLLGSNGGCLEYGDLGAVVPDIEVRSKMAYVAHSTQLYGLLTARENIELFSDIRRTLGQEARSTEEVLRRVGLGDAMDRPVSSFSRGMAQRVVLARALAAEPELMLLDEPLTALDREGRDEIIALLRQERKRGAGVLISSHDLDGILRVADRVVWLSNGIVSAEVQSPGDIHAFRTQVLAATAKSPASAISHSSPTA